MDLLQPNWQELDRIDSEYIRNLHPVYETVLDTFNKVKDPHVTGNITLLDALQKIKFNFGQDISPGMYLTSKYIDGKKNTEYDELKEDLPAICYNASFNGYKNLQNTKKIHNLMFLDIDGFSSREEALAYKSEVIKKYNWILACSLSLSKIGLHIIVMVDRISDSQDYNRKYDFISKEYFCGGLDHDSKSLSRFTILPYDHDIYINENPVVLPIDSITKKSMGSTYIPGKATSSTAVGLSDLKSMGSTCIQSGSQHDNEKSISCSMGGEGICTTHTISELHELNEFLNTSARQNRLIFKSFANEDLIEDPNKPLFNYTGFPVVEINLFIYGKQSITEGRRTSFLGAILSQMMYLNVVLPEEPNPDVRKNLLGFMKSVNRKYCNPALPNDEVLRSYNNHWKRYHEGKLDITKYLIQKRSLWSRNCSLTSNQKKSKTMTKINEHKREGNRGVLREVIQSMADNGEKITQQLVADEIKKREIKGLGITTIKNLWKYFKPSVQAYKKGISTDIKINETDSDKTQTMNTTNKHEIDIDADDDALDLGADILENPENILAKQDNGNNTDDGFSLTPEQQQSMFNRVYSRHLPLFKDAEDRETLYNLFLAKLQDYDCDEKKILCMKPESITDANIFAKQSNLESQLILLCKDINITAWRMMNDTSD